MGAQPQIFGGAVYHSLCKVVHAHVQDVPNAVLGLEHAPHTSNILGSSPREPARWLREDCDARLVGMNERGGCRNGRAVHTKWPWLNAACTLTEHAAVQNVHMVWLACLHVPNGQKASAWADFEVDRIGKEQSGLLSRIWCHSSVDFKLLRLPFA